MTVLFDNYRLVKSSRTNFLTGSLPDWLIDGSRGGGSITAESENGGRAVLSSGTQSTGDEAKLETNDLDPGPFDGMYMRSVVRHGGAVSNPRASSDICGWRGPNGDNNILHRVYVTNLSEQRNTITIERNGSTTLAGTRAWTDDLHTLESELLWDTTDGRILHRFQDAFAQEVTSVQPDLSSNFFRGKINVLTNDTEVDRVMYVYEVEIGYVDKLDG
ncbi:hypothetical protein [Halosimplex pelagicum]|uniref:Uncharacterized protein n=1 Tax=Halosimplex pelagicum TaxID=869886 RepID=A0A7D5TBT7_9EURY|nr:hypothetical protein [Halosimplex pelagicum]QLH80995.1 hypothetical protein HZS54_04800 [Halosimplex pelagicum]QLH82453.1 hypothetical protein HZS54_12885 [Halosimplex pelagicum]QLH82509.1 hypothetical protein HZS54_13190 [Halosimplex pelagicum]